MEVNPILQLKPSYLFFEMPLYTEVKVTIDNLNEAWDILDYNENKDRLNNIPNGKRINGYNPYLNEKTTYKVEGGSGHELDYSRLLFSETLVKISFRCLRTDEVFYCFVTSKAKDGDFFYENRTLGDSNETEIERVKEVSIIKIGQYPSLADFYVKDYRKFRKVLNEEKLKELVKGIRLAASGVGIGAFAYLRRIFEFLISDAFEFGKQTNPQWDQTEFEKLRMDEKIKFVDFLLPPILVENRSLYQILSLGLHSLSDALCLQYFPVVRDAIELILDRKLTQINEGKREAKIQKDIHNLNQQIKGANE